MTWYNTGGTGGPAEPTELQYGWVSDSNDTVHFFERIYDEDTGSFSGIAYFDAPGGTSTTPVGTVQPVAGVSSGTGGTGEAFIGFWGESSASPGFNVWVQGVRGSNGTVTWQTYDAPDGSLISNSADVSGPAILPTPNVTVEQGFEVLYGWLQDSNDDYIFYTQTLDESDGTYAAPEFLDGPGGAAVVPVGALRPAEPPAAPQFVEVVRLDGDSATATAVPEVPVHPGNNTLQPAVAGQAYTVTGLRTGLAWRSLPGTADGATVTINSLTHTAETGAVYADAPWQDLGGAYDYTVEFAAGAGAEIEIRITKGN